MMNGYLFIIAGIVLSMNSYSQTIGFDKSNLEASRVYMSIEKMNGKQVVKVVKDSTQNGADLPTFVKIKGIDFKDGIIEIKVLSRLLKTAPASERSRFLTTSPSSTTRRLVSARA